MASEILSLSDDETMKITNGILNRDAVEDKKKDSFQLGGEVLMDSKGKVVYLHRCKDSEDRPAIDEIIKLIPITEHNKHEIKTKRFTSKTCSVM